MAESFVAHVSRGKTLLILLGGLVLTGLGGFILLNPGEFPEYARIFGILIPISWIAWACVVFFGLCAVVGVRQLLRTGPVMEIGPAGLHWKRWSDTTIPWSAFGRAEAAQIHRQKFLSLWLHDAEAWRSTKLLGRLAGANKAMGFGDIALSTQGLDRSFDEMVEAVARHAPELFGH